MPIIRIRYLKDPLNQKIYWAYLFSLFLSVCFAFAANYLKRYEILIILISLAGVAFLFLGFILAVIHQMRSTFYFYGGCATAIVGIIFFLFAVLATYVLSEFLFPIFW